MFTVVIGCRWIRKFVELVDLANQYRVQRILAVVAGWIYRVLDNRLEVFGNRGERINLAFLEVVLKLESVSDVAGQPNSFFTKFLKRVEQ